MSMFNKVTKTFQWGSHQVRMETGEIARQSTGAVLVDIEGTVVLATVVAAAARYVAEYQRQRQRAAHQAKPDDRDPRFLQSITDQYGGIDKDKARAEGYEIEAGDAWIACSADYHAGEGRPVLPVGPEGLGPAFELPDDVTRLVVEGGMELDPAVRRAGLTDNERIGYAQGIIGILSGGRVTRMDYSRPAVSMALVGMGL